MFDSKIIEASELMQDDRFKMAGKHYRIAATTTNKFGDEVIRFYALDDHAPHMNLMVLAANTKFKIYNLIEL